MEWLQDGSETRYEVMEAKKEKNGEEERKRTQGQIQAKEEPEI